MLVSRGNNQVQNYHHYASRCLRLLEYYVTLNYHLVGRQVMMRERPVRRLNQVRKGLEDKGSLSMLVSMCSDTAISTLPREMMLYTRH